MSPHLLDVRVYYEDTDAAGIVYYATYLRFAERARTELLRARGLDHPTLRDTAGGTFAVTRCAVRYLAPARLDDLLTVETTPINARGARLVLEQVVRRAAARLAVLEVELAFLGPDLRPRRLPAALTA